MQCQKIWYSEIFELSKSMVIEHKNEATLAEVLFYAKKKKKKKYNSRNQPFY